MTLSKEQIEAIQARAEKATPGPWTTDQDEDLNAFSEIRAPIHPRVRAISGEGWPGFAQVVVEMDSKSGTVEAEANRDLILNARTDIPALCQMALRAIELEAEKQDQHDRFIRQVMDVEKSICKFLNREWLPSGMSLVSLVTELQSELTATRNALEEERERCAKAVLDPKNQTGEHTPFIFGVMHDCAKAIRALPSPQVKV